MTGKQERSLHLSCGACGGRECAFLDGEGVLPLYRRETERTLQRYFYLSLDLGRLPSFLGQEVFRARVSSTRAHTFEDLVIFVHDIERRLEELQPELLETIAAIVFLDQSHEEAAASLCLSRRQVERRYATALDELSRRLLVTGLLRPSHASLQERDCEVCLRNPAFTVMDSSVAAWDEGRVDGRPAEAAVASTELEDSGLPPKKPAASVRRVELKHNQPRWAIIARLQSQVQPNTPS
jgi:hypothetical protein